MKRLLLISNSTLHGGGYLDHCEGDVKSFLGDSVKNVTFVPFARPSGVTWDEYAGKARERFEKMGYELKSIHQYDNPAEAAANAQSIFIGGGNSFVLLSELQKRGLIEPIRKAVLNGAPYIGTSAGSNAACPSIKTTNDMPIVETDGFAALDLFPYQINPHYLDPDPKSTHKGETRETRIKEFLIYNDKVVVGLREGCSILAEGDSYKLLGINGARIFRKGQEPIEIKAGEELKI